eukprot:CAMPEP_0172191748 /NCGR_PEP_ID=MMETSP1050-20130122/23900_1 /TAXON_ID=233186 /ORGANISM="Cryptomonas curvata, Strain CCAP979/52" /LENGTH=114 /DNA_ID=CAMNT_0012866885 /DNA_START=119 /DNA_END=459 /DNA_ORIENTATION=+
MYSPIIPAGVPCDGGTRHVLNQSDLSTLAASLDFEISELESRFSGGKEGLHMFKVPQLQTIAKYLRASRYLKASSLSNVNKRELIDRIFAAIYPSSASSPDPKSELSGSAYRGP